MPTIFGPVADGVPSPLIRHDHPYPTRYHGPIWNYPYFTQPYRENPYALAPYAGLGAAASAGHAPLRGMPSWAEYRQGHWWLKSGAEAEAATFFDRFTWVVDNHPGGLSTWYLKQNAPGQLPTTLWQNMQQAAAAGYEVLWGPYPSRWFTPPTGSAGWLFFAPSAWWVQQFNEHYMNPNEMDVVHVLPHRGRWAADRTARAAPGHGPVSGLGACGACGVKAGGDAFGAVNLTGSPSGNMLLDGALGALVGAIVADKTTDRVIWAAGGAVATIVLGALGLAGTVGAGWYVRR